MTNEELVRIYQAGTPEQRKEIGNQLYTQNTGILYRICETYKKADDIDDLMQVAAIGMLAAADTYDESRGVKFISAAYQNIRHELQEHASHCRLVNVGRGNAGQAYRLKAITQQITAQIGREPTLEELARCAGISAERAAQLLSDLDLLDRCTPLTGAYMDGEAKDGITVEDNVPDPVDYEEMLIDREYRRELTAIWDEVNKLPEKQADIITRRYQQGQTFEQIGQDTDRTAQNVHGMHNRALTRLSHSTRVRRLLSDAELYSAGLHHTSLSAFRETGLASQEWYLFKGRI